MPVISNLAFTVTDTTIVASWTTDTSSDSNLSAGGKAAVDNGVAANSTIHQCIVAGLSPSTSYSCVVTSGGTSSSPQNVSTSAAVTRHAITGGAIGTPYVSAGSADTLYNAVSNDGLCYVMMDDSTGLEGSGSFNANVMVQKFTDETLLTGTNVKVLNYGGSNTFNGTDGPSGQALTNKGCGMWAQNGSLFVFIMRQLYNGTTGVNGYYQAVIRSDDHGGSWNNFVNPNTFTSGGTPPYPPSPSPYMFGNGNFGFVSPVLYAIDDGTLGYNTTGNQIDGANAYVYLMVMDTAHVNNNKVYLARMPRIRLQNLDYSATQFWGGPSSPTPTDFVNDSNWITWTSGVSGMTAIYTDSGSVLGGGAGRVSRTSMAYIPAMNYYCLLTWYRPSGQGITNSATWVISTGPTPAGPWTLLTSKNYSPQGWYNPIFMHRTVASNVSSSTANLSVIFQGDFNQQALYYHPSISSLTLTTGAPMPTVVQTVVTDTGATTPSSLAFPPVNITAGNLVVIGVRNGSSTTISSISPGSWTLRNQGGTGAQHMRFADIQNHPGGTNITYTVSLSAATGNWWCVLWEISGCLTSGALDAQATGDTAGTSPITAGSLTTAQANEILLAIAALNTSAGSGATWSVSPPAGVVVDFQPQIATGSLAQGVACHAILSSVQSGIAPVATKTGGSGYGSPTLGTIQVITYKSAAFNISGNAGVAGATVAYSGAASGSVTADGSGNYTIPILANGSYTITPSKIGYRFNPASSNQTVSGSDISGVNFTAALSASSGRGFKFGFRF